MLFASVAFAASDARVQRGMELFDEGEFSKSRDGLVTVVESPALSTPDRIQARSYLAAAYHALGDVASAKAQLLVLAREQPQYQLDGGTFLPELIALAQEARAEVAQETRRLEPVKPRPEPVRDAEAVVVPAPVPAAPPVQVGATAPPVTRPGLVPMLIPFGVGQFTLDQNVKGTLFLAGEVVALGTSGVALAMFESNKTSGAFLQGGTFRDPARAQTLQTIHLVAGYTGIALMVGGIIDALISRAELAESGGGGLARTGAFPAKDVSFTGQGLLIRF